MGSAIVPPLRLRIPACRLKSECSSRRTRRSPSSCDTSILRTTRFGPPQRPSRRADWSYFPASQPVPSLLPTSVERKSSCPAQNQARSDGSTGCRREAILANAGGWTAAKLRKRHQSESLGETVRRLNGGGASPIRTGLRSDFPANREIYREFAHEGAQHSIERLGVGLGFARHGQPSPWVHGPTYWPGPVRPPNREGAIL